jgi:REP element-mobilizing transposase RayT
VVDGTVVGMARQLRIEYTGAIYHVTCRMIGDWRTEQARLFKDDKDRKRFLEALAERVKQYNIRLYLFVLMANHFHLVFETPDGNCSKFMQSLSTAYTVYYNLRHRRHGHLLDGRYKAKLVEGEEYLLALTRYVHLNPVRIGPMMEKPIEEKIRYLRQYPWSTYQGYIGEKKRFDYVEYGPILGEMSGKRKGWPEQYRKFVATGLAEDDLEFKAARKDSPRCIGSTEFRAWVDELYDKRAKSQGAQEDIAFRHVMEPLDPGLVLKIIAGEFKVNVEDFRRRRRNSSLRAIAARYLIRYSGLDQRGVARLLNAGSGAAISKQISRHAEEMDGGMKRMLTGVEERLDEARKNRQKKPIVYVKS